MGPRDFGGFTLVLTYGQMIANLVQFQSWKGVIRYGAIHRAGDRADRLARLFGFTATLDAAGAIGGALLAIVGVPLIAGYLHWPADQQRLAQGFGVLLLLATGGTASGILRLHDRFDLLAYTEAVGPMVRVVGALAAWLMSGGIIAFLGVWAGAALGQSLAQWLAALLIERAKLKVGPRPFRKAAAENHRLWRFMILTNISNSLSLFWMQLGTLAVGNAGGAAQAGGFRISSRIAKGVAKPVETVTRALYPELARLVAEGEHRTVRAILLRVTAMAALLAIAMVVIVGVGGKPILHLIAGRKFEFAHVFLTVLAFSAAIDLAGFALEPFHTAHGRAGRVLRIRLVGACFYLATLVVLLPRIGAIGAAFAAVGASAIMFAQLAVSTAQILRSTDERGPPAIEF